MVVVMMMFMLMIMVVTAFVLIMVVVMLVLCLGSQCLQFCLESGFLFHRSQNLFASQLVPRSCDDRSLRVVFTQQRDSSLQLVFLHTLSTGEDNGGSMLDLVIIKLTEVLHVHLDLGGVGNGGKTIEDSAGSISRLDRTDNVGQFADAGRLNQNTVRMVLFNDLMQCGGKIPDQAAADTAGVHLIDLNTRILQKSPVNSDFTKFVFNQHQLFTLIRLCNQLFNQSRFTGTQKTGENINFGHETRLPFYLTKKYGLQW